jgi:hypothetical protein
MDTDYLAATTNAIVNPNVLVGLFANSPFAGGAYDWMVPGATVGSDWWFQVQYYLGLNPGNFFNAAFNWTGWTPGFQTAAVQSHVSIAEYAANLFCSTVGGRDCRQ